MDRRTFVGSALGSASLGLSSAGSAAALETDADRPSLAITPDAPGSWRVRSWEHRAGSWRPVIARLIRADTGFRLDGPVAAADRAALAQWIEAQRAA